MQLKDLQRVFSDAIFSVNTDPLVIERAADEIEPNTVQSSLQRLQIYRDSVMACLVRALNDLYPVCAKLVGSNFFDAMAQRYVQQHPSPSPDIGDFGEQFADFIEQFEPAQSLPYLPDTARLEWAWHRAFHAVDESGLDFQALAAIDEAQQANLIFHLPQSARLLESPYPVDQIWQANQDDANEDQVVDLAEGGVKLIVWRNDYDVQIDQLSEPVWLLLTALKAHRHFVDVCDDLSTIGIDQLLPQCVQQGWVARFSLPSKKR